MYRYKQTYDLPRGEYDLEKLKKKYQNRAKIFRNPPHFKYGTTPAEAKCLAYVLDLAMDATPTAINQYGVPSSKNMEIIDGIIKRTNILECIFEHGGTKSPVPMHYRRPKVTKDCILGSLVAIETPTTLQMFQLLLSARSLSFITPYPCIYSFPDSQRAAYMDFESTPLFGGYGGLEVNMIWALHGVNFFRYHMLRDSESTLCPAFRDLSEANDGTEMPQMWKEKLSNNDNPVPLGSSWKGSYGKFLFPPTRYCSNDTNDMTAYLHRKEVYELRTGKYVGSKAYDDHNVDLGHKAIQVSAIPQADTRQMLTCVVTRDEIPRIGRWGYLASRL
jgi:hypothetical protein